MSFLDCSTSSPGGSFFLTYYGIQRVEILLLSVLQAGAKHSHPQNLIDPCIKSQLGAEVIYWTKNKWSEIFRAHTKKQVFQKHLANRH
jgi:hypothetical protein